MAALSLGVVVPGTGLGWGWRGLYYLGALPALIAVFVLWKLREPDKWLAARAAAVRNRQTSQMGSIAELLRHPTWRRNTLVGLGLAIAGVLGLWGVGFYSPELIDSAIPTVEPAMRPKVQAVIAATDQAAHVAAVEAMDDLERRKLFELVRRTRTPGDTLTEEQILEQPLPEVRKAKLGRIMQEAITEDAKTRLKSIGGMLQQVGAFLGMVCFTAVTARLGRRRAFFIGLLLAWGSLILTFATFNKPWQIYYLWPVLGFGTLAPFGGYAIYFPELFPTRLRTTGTSFCYNVGRYVAAAGPFILGPLAMQLDGLTTIPGFRLAAMTLASSYLIGLVALIWAPETLNQPLPDDERTAAH
jgi:MFS family permease